MNSREYQEIQKAYFEVYEIDEANTPGDELYNQLFRGANTRKVKGSKTPQPGQNRYLTKQNQKKSAANYAADMGRNRTPSASDSDGHGWGSKNEQVDLHAAILSHLLDEGYADTLEAAEGIMVSMSEEWREEILEANTVMSVSSPSGNPRELNKAKAKPSRNLEGKERLDAFRDIRQQDVNRRAPEIEKRIKGRHRIRINP